MIPDVSIQKAHNGYILTIDHIPEVYYTIDDVFSRLLLYFEGRCKDFTGDQQGSVVIERG